MWMPCQPLASSLVRQYATSPRPMPDEPILLNWREAMKVREKFCFWQWVLPSIPGAQSYPTQPVRLILP